MPLRLGRLALEETVQCNRADMVVAATAIALLRIANHPIQCAAAIAREQGAAVVFCDQRSSAHNNTEFGVAAVTTCGACLGNVRTLCGVVTLVLLFLLFLLFCFSDLANLSQCAREKADERSADRL